VHQQPACNRPNRRPGLKRLSWIAATFAALAASAAPAAVAPEGAAHTCQAGYRHAVIGGRHTCLRVGQRCVRRFDAQYHRYGFHCHGRRLTRAATTPPSLPAAGRIVARIPLPGDPQHLAFGAGSLWATTFDTDELLRVDARTNAVVARIPLVRRQSTAVRWLGFGEGSVWVSNFDDNSVSRIDPATNAVVATIPVTLNPTGVGFGAGSVWVTNHRAATISRIDPATNRVVAEIPVGPPGQGGPQVIAAAAAGAIWVTVPNAMALVRVDPESNAVVARIADGPTCGSLAEGFDSVWGDASCQTNTLVRVDVRSHKVTRLDLPSNQRVRWVTTGFGSVWVTSDVQHLLRVDPATDRVAAELTFEGPALGMRVVAGEGSLWVGRPAAVVRVAPLP
jgi:virginiamycin B lyase